MLLGSPCMCMRHTEHCDSMTASRAPSAESAVTSLISSAPACAARRMTRGLRVSMEITRPVAARSPSITGRTRRSSWSSGTGSAPGRVDSPPTSRMAAPSSAIRTPCWIAARGSSKRPPSEKESGVTLSTPMTSGCVRSNVLVPHRSNIGGGPCAPRLRAVPQSPSMLASGRANRAAARCTLRRRLGRWFVGQGLVPVLGRLRHLARHDVLELLLIDRLVLNEGIRHRMQLVESAGQDLPGALEVALDDAAHFFVDRMRSAIRHLLVLSDAAAKEDLARLLRVRQGSELVGQAPLRDHVARELRGTLDIVRRPGRDGFAPEYELLGDAAAEQCGDRTLQAPLRQAVAILLGQELRDAERAAARDDRDLVHRIVLGDGHADDGVTRLVIGGHALFLLAHDHRAPLRAHHDLVLGPLELLHSDDALVGTRREQGRLVDEVGQIRTRESRGSTRNQARLHVIRKRNASHVDAEDLLAPPDIRQWHDDLAIEASGSQKGRIQHVRTVRGGNDDDSLIALETIHLHEQLVQSLLALIVAPAESGAPMAADRIDLIDEYDARGMLLRLLEHVAHARSADPDEHLDEVRARDGEERNLGLARNGPRQQGLAGAGRADHEDSLRDLAAKFLELAGIFQEIHDLGYLLLGLVHPCHIGKGDIDLVLTQEARTTLAEGHGPPASRCSLHLPQHVDEHEDEKQRGRELQEQLGHEV